MSSRPYSEATQAAVDGEVSRLLREAEERAVGLLRAHREELDALVALLLERETVDGSDVYRLAGLRGQVGRPVGADDDGSSRTRRRRPSPALTVPHRGSDRPVGVPRGHPAAVHDHPGDRRRRARQATHGHDDGA